MDRIDAIRDAVCKYYNISEMDMYGKSRERRYVTPRQIAIYLHSCFDNTITNDTMFRLVNRDRTSFYHAHKTISNLIEIDDSIKKDISVLMSIVEKGRAENQKFIIDTSKNTVRVFRNGVLLSDDDTKKYKNVFDRWLMEASVI
jgi:hypothetical protein